MSDGSGNDEFTLGRTGHGSVRLELNRPQRANALNPTLVESLTRQVANAYHDGTRLLVIRGRGKHFCSGLDRSPEGGASFDSFSQSGLAIESLLQLIWDAPFATAAHVQGKAIGAGADLAAACDYRFATPDSTFCFPGFKLFGVSIGNRRLAELVGSKRAFDLVLRGAPITGEQAFGWGLVNAIASPDEIDDLLALIERDLGSLPNAAIPALRMMVSL